MSSQTNRYGQPIGPALEAWQPRPLPQGQIFTGQYCRLEPLDAARHGRELYAAYALAEDGRDWTWLPVGRFDDEASYLAFAQQCQQSPDYLHFAVIDRQSGQAVGSLALMRIEPQHGVMEVGFVVFSPLLKQTRMATEAHYLLMRYAFEQLGYRRYEWKCDSCNQPSYNAALRLGFRYEGTFRQVVVYKNRSRDTAWFSIIDCEWPQVKLGFERWLAADNFDARGQQRARLETLRQA
ncbi:GNAT family N-acetyltransferase [Pantoea sp. SGAir0184]